MSVLTLQLSPLVSGGGEIHMSWSTVWVPAPFPRPKTRDKSPAVRTRSVSRFSLRRFTVAPFFEVCRCYQQTGGHRAPPLFSVVSLHSAGVGRCYETNRRKLRNRAQ